MRKLIKGCLILIGGIIVIFGILLLLVPTPEGEYAAGPTPTPTLTVSQVKERARDDISYDDLARYTERYVGEYVFYRGEVNQVIEHSDANISLRVNVTKGDFGFWSDTIYVDWNRRPQETRVLANDIVLVWGQVIGRKEYTAIFGQQVILPHIGAATVEVEAK